jgi:hypothetical protein
LNTTDGWRVATLGPAGTDHERAARAYARSRLPGVVCAELFETFDAAERFLSGPGQRLVVINSAHSDVDLMVTRSWRHISMVDHFAMSTMPLALVSRADVTTPTSIALMPATRGYLDLQPWARVEYVPAKPVAVDRVLAGDVDAAIVSLPSYERHKTDLRLMEVIGPVLCCWLVFGRPDRVGELIAPLVALAAGDPSHSRAQR